MADPSERPVLYVVACGGRPAGDLPDFITQLQADGWEVCVIATPSALKFMDTGRLAELTGHVVRYDYKQPDEPDVLPLPDALVVAPATFNTINKWALGISDTLALGLLNEATGLGLPIAAAPWPNAALARHPVFRRSIATLAEWGVRVVLDYGRLPDATAASAVFPWDDLRAELPRLKDRADAGHGLPRGR